MYIFYHVRAGGRVENFSMAGQDLHPPGNHQDTV